MYSASASSQTSIGVTAFSGALGGIAASHYWGQAVLYNATGNPKFYPGSVFRTSVNVFAFASFGVAASCLVTAVQAHFTKRESFTQQDRSLATFSAIFALLPFVGSKNKSSLRAILNSVSTLMAVAPAVMTKFYSVRD